MRRTVLGTFLAMTILCTWFEGNRTVLAQSEPDEIHTEQSLTQQLPYKYYGNSFSHKFHKPSCPFGMCISKRHLVLFHFRKEAIEAHYAPCRYCLPPVWWTVHGVILPRKDAERSSHN
jgi:hypothetical protein